MTPVWVTFVVDAAGPGVLPLASLTSTSVMAAPAQQAAPGLRALASSLPLGLSWGLASLTLPLLGWIGDQVGGTAMLPGLAWLPLVAAAIMVLLMPTRRPAPLVEPAPAAASG